MELVTSSLLCDFAKRDQHLALWSTHNAPALSKHFPEYSLDEIYRIRSGIRPKYMRDRVYITLKCILEFADHHKQEAGRLKFSNLEAKYGLSRSTVHRRYRDYLKEVEQ